MTSRGTDGRRAKPRVCVDHGHAWRAKPGCVLVLDMLGERRRVGEAQLGVRAPNQDVRLQGQEGEASKCCVQAGEPAARACIGC